MSTAGDNRPSRMDDARLIRAAQQGNAAAFEQLVQQYDRAVLRLTIHLTGSQEDGQDMYQEAFLRAYINLTRFRSSARFIHGSIALPPISALITFAGSALEAAK